LNIQETEAGHFERRQAKKRRWTAVCKATAARRELLEATAARNSTATPCSVDSMIDTGSYTSETSIDEGTETGMLSESTDEAPDEDEEILHAFSLCYNLKRSYVSNARKELANKSYELSLVKSELQATNDQLAETNSELAEEKKMNAKLMSENSSISKLRKH